MSKYDVTVIGSGPGGYVAAIRCAQLGLRTAIIERYPTLGGTCLNVGCIPSKALLDSSEHYHAAAHSFASHGIALQNLAVNMPQMLARKNEVVAQTCLGVKGLMDKNKIDVFYGHGTIQTAHSVAVFDKSDASKLLHTIETDKIIIATGSKPVCPPAFNYDKKRIITSTEALHIDHVPASMVIVGAGVIGLELGSVYARLGTKVSVVEYADSILGGMDGDLGKDMLKTLRKELGFTFYLSHAVAEVRADGEQIHLLAHARKDNSALNLTADYCLIAVGRKPYTDGLGLENVGIERDERGRIKTNDHLQTNLPNVFAIGDVIVGAMLAHKAEEEGVLVAEYLAGQKPHINYNLIPGIVYTWPEVASVGQTEEQLKAAAVPYKAGKFFFRALGRARASGDTNGFVKILAHKETDEVLGMHIIGARAADIIMEGVAAMEFRASAEDIARFSHGHPTYTEAVKEAALDCTEKRSLHS